MQESPRSRFRYLYLAAALALAGILLYYSLKGLDWSRVRQILSTAKLPLVALWLMIGTLPLFLRAMRWRLLLQASAPVSIPTAFWATAGGYAGNCFLPARAGELIRTVMISKDTTLSNTYVLTTAIAERMTDAVALVLIGSAVLLSLPAPPGWLAGAIRAFALLGLAGAAAIILAPKLERVWRFFLRRLPVPDTFRERLQGLLEQILMGFRSFHNAKRLILFIALTAVIWLTDACATVTGAHALGMNMSLSVAFLLIAGLGLGSALPSTPGYVGIYQFVAVSVLTPFGFGRADAIAFILLSQALQYALFGTLGLLALQRYHRIQAKAAKVDSEAVA